MDFTETAEYRLLCPSILIGLQAARGEHTDATWFPPHVSNTSETRQAPGGGRSNLDSAIWQWYKKDTPHTHDMLGPISFGCPNKGDHHDGPSDCWRHRVTDGRRRSSIEINERQPLPTASSSPLMPDRDLIKSYVCDVQTLMLHSPKFEPAFHLEDIDLVEEKHFGIDDLILEIASRQFVGAPESPQYDKGKCSSGNLDVPAATLSIALRVKRPALASAWTEHIPRHTLETGAEGLTIKFEEKHAAVCTLEDTPPTASFSSNTPHEWTGGLRSPLFTSRLMTFTPVTRSEGVRSTLTEELKTLHLDAIEDPDASHRNNPSRDLTLSTADIIALHEHRRFRWADVNNDIAWSIDSDLSNGCSGTGIASHDIPRMTQHQQPQQRPVVAPLAMQQQPYPTPPLPSYSPYQPNTTDVVLKVSLPPYHAKVPSEFVTLVAPQGVSGGDFVTMLRTRFGSLLTKRLPEQEPSNRRFILRPVVSPEARPDYDCPAIDDDVLIADLGLSQIALCCDDADGQEASSSSSELRVVPSSSSSTGKESQSASTLESTTAVKEPLVNGHSTKTTTTRPSSLERDVRASQQEKNESCDRQPLGRWNLIADITEDTRANRVVASSSPPSVTPPTATKREHALNESMLEQSKDNEGQNASPQQCGRWSAMMRHTRTSQPLSSQTRSGNWFCGLEQPTGRALPKLRFRTKPQTSSAGTTRYVGDTAEIAVMTTTTTTATTSAPSRGLLQRGWRQPFRTFVILSPSAATDVTRAVDVESGHVLRVLSQLIELSKDRADITVVETAENSRVFALLSSLSKMQNALLLGEEKPNLASLYFESFFTAHQVATDSPIQALADTDSCLVLLKKRPKLSQLSSYPRLHPSNQEALALAKTIAFDDVTASQIASYNCDVMVVKAGRYIVPHGQRQYSRCVRSRWTPRVQTFVVSQHLVVDGKRMYHTLENFYWASNDERERNRRRVSRTADPVRPDLPDNYLQNQRYRIAFFTAKEDGCLNVDRDTKAVTDVPHASSGDSFTAPPPLEELHTKPLLSDTSSSNDESPPDDASVFDASQHLALLMLPPEVPVVDIVHAVLPPTREPIVEVAFAVPAAFLHSIVATNRGNNQGGLPLVSQDTPVQLVVRYRTDSTVSSAMLMAKLNFLSKSSHVPPPDC